MICVNEAKNPLQIHETRLTYCFSFHVNVSNEANAEKKTEQFIDFFIPNEVLQLFIFCHLKTEEQRNLFIYVGKFDRHSMKNVDM